MVIFSIDLNRRVYVFDDRLLNPWLLQNISMNGENSGEAARMHKQIWDFTVSLSDTW